MNDKRIIAISLPRLHKIRDEFRSLWSAVEGKIWRELHVAMEKLSFDDANNLLSIDEMEKLGILKRFRSLQERQRDLREDFNRSICSCYICGRNDSDMEYLEKGSALGEPAWYCLNCVQLMRQGYTNEQVKKESGSYNCELDHSREPFF